MSANIQQRIEAAERELAEAKRLLAGSQQPADPCAYECTEFRTWMTTGYKHLLSIEAKQRWKDESMILTLREARELRRIINIFLGEVPQ